MNTFRRRHPFERLLECVAWVVGGRLEMCRELAHLIGGRYQFRKTDSTRRRAHAKRTRQPHDWILVALAGAQHNTPPHGDAGNGFRREQRWKNPGAGNG